MSTTTKFKSLPVVYLLLCISFSSKSQTFTKITDASNPIVNDAFNSGGGSWVDINHDGLLDLFVSNGNLTNQNNTLYLNLGGGNFHKILTGDIIRNGGTSIGSTWGDYNNDGNADCFVTNRNFTGNFLYKGNGDTTFTRITSGPVVTDLDDSNSSSWVDIDNDGDLDLYIVNFQDNDFLYINNGAPDFSFTPNASISIVKDNTNFSITGAWADFNNDLKPDLYVGNAGLQNDDLYINNGNLSFTQKIMDDGKSTLGESWGDFDNDGDLDLFVAGYLNEGNVLYVNSGPPNFNLVKITSSAVTEAANCVGSAWGDFDNDGDLDLFVCNDGGNNFLYQNSGYPNYTFTKVTTGVEVTDGGNSFGCAWADYDNDGDLDLFVANQLNEKNFLYRNNGNSNNWITVKCSGTQSNKSGIGTKVHVKATINGVAIWQMQEVPAQTGYNSQNLWLHFGLGDAALIDSMRIQWPSGIVENFTNVVAKKIYNATEGQGITTSVHDPNLNRNVFSIETFPNPCKDFCMVNMVNEEAGIYSISLNDVSGKKIQSIYEGFITTGNHSYQINTSQLPAGIYLVKAEGKLNSSITKMIIAK